MRNFRVVLLVMGALALLFALPLAGCGKTEPAPNACEVLDGQCPNFCANGIGVKGETCGGTGDCGCGLFCKEGTCQPYEGEHANCSCTAPDPDAGDVSEPDTAPVDTGPDLSCNGKPAPAGADCNPYCQIGCSDEEQCTFTGSSIGCDGVGEAGIGETCNNSIDCQKGMACFSLNSDPVSVCRQFCQGDSDCPADRKCTQSVTFDNGAFEAKFCGDPVIGCNAFESTCGDGQGCYYGNGTTKCMPAGTKEKDALCTGANDCKSGLHCLVTCREACSTNADNADQPKCKDVCGGGDDDIKELSPENGFGVCVPDEPPAECDIFAQTGCPASDGCYLITGGFGCIPAGSKKPGEACTGGNECAKGSLCINSTCAEICSVREADADKDYFCTTKCKDNGTITPGKWGIGYCKDADPAEPCDFWAQDCEAGKNCYLVSGGGTCMQTGGSTPEGGECNFVQDCAPGLACGNKVCLKPCSIADFPEGLCKPLTEPAKSCEETSDCGDGETCTSEQWPAGGLTFCADTCSANGKDIIPIVQGQIGFCAE